MRNIPCVLTVIFFMMSVHFSGDLMASHFPRDPDLEKSRIIFRPSKDQNLLALFSPTREHNQNSNTHDRLNQLNQHINELKQKIPHIERTLVNLRRSLENLERERSTLVAVKDDARILLPNRMHCYQATCFFFCAVTVIILLSFAVS